MHYSPLNVRDKHVAADGSMNKGVFSGVSVPLMTSQRSDSIMYATIWTPFTT